MGDPQWGPVEKNPPGALARPDKNKPPRTPAQRRAILALKGLGISLALILVAGFAVVFIGYTTTERPDPNADFQTATTGVYFNDGTTRLGRFEVQNRTPLTFDQMPDVDEAGHRGRGEPHLLDRPRHLHPRHDPRGLGDRPR